MTQQSLRRRVSTADAGRRFIALFYTLCASAFLAAGSKIKGPVAQVNVAEASPRYRLALQMAGGFPAKVAVSFLGEENIVVSSMDGSYYPAFGHVATNAFHFTLDVFALGESPLKLSNQIRFNTDTSDAAFAAMPSGKLMVNTGKEIMVLDQSQHVVLEQSVEKACGSFPGINIAAPFRTKFFASSEDVGFVLLERAGRAVPPDGPPIPIEALGCWFSTSDLHLIARISLKRTLAAATLRDLVVYSDGNWSLSPTDQHPLSMPPLTNCDVSELEQKFPHFYLLHFESASAFTCRKGAISILRGAHINTINMKGSENWYFRTEAWRAPLAIFVGGYLRVPLWGNHFSGETVIRLVNYVTGASVELPLMRINVHSAVYAGQTTQYAISPSGKHVAVLTGALLSIYETPPEVLN